VNSGHGLKTTSISLVEKPEPVILVCKETAGNGKYWRIFAMHVNITDKLRYNCEPYLLHLRYCFKVTSHHKLMDF